jgi:hypothetical protein
MWSLWFPGQVWQNAMDLAGKVPGCRAAPPRDCAAMSHNLTAANLTRGALASGFHARARGATIRAHLITVAARIARRGRGRLTLHLPQDWHREQEWMNLFEAACGPSARAA